MDTSVNINRFIAFLCIVFILLITTIAINKSIYTIHNLQVENNKLKNKINYLVDEYNNVLTNLTNLHKTYEELNNTYQQLNLSYQRQINETVRLRKENVDLKEKISNSQMVYPIKEQELLQFLVEDKTDEHEYIPDKYVCWDFAMDLVNNAKKRHIQAGFVMIEYYGGGGHSVVAFNTTDKGIVFVEPQEDTFVTLCDNCFYYAWQIKRFGIIW